MRCSLARGSLELALSVVALLSLLTVALLGLLTVALRLAVAAHDGHLLGGLLPVPAHGRQLLGGLLSKVTLRVSALLGVSTLLGLVRLLILGRIGRAHRLLPCW